MMTSIDTKMNLDIAVVVSASNVHHKSSTYAAISKIIDLNDRYADSKISLVPWDQPADWNRYSHILLSTGISYASCYEQFLEWLNQLPTNVSKRVFNPPRVINWNISKIYLKDYRNKGIKIPPTVFIQPGETIAFEEVLHSLEEQSESSLESIVVKSLIDAGGYSTECIVLSDGGKEDFNKALAASKRGLIVQKFLTTVKSEGEWSLVYFDRKLSHVVIKTPSSEGFKVQSRFGGGKFPVQIADVPKEILNFGDDVINATEEENLLYARVDILRDLAGQPCLMELEVFEPNLYLSTCELSETFLETISRY